MSEHLKLRGALVAGLVACGSGMALAQATEGTSPPAPPAVEAPAPAPPATPPAAGEAAPATTPPTPTTAAPPPETTVPAVDVIQEQAPKPKPVAKKAAPAPAAAEPTPVAAPAPEPVAAVAPTVGPPAADTPVNMSPVSGSEIPLAKVPGAVGRATSQDIATDGTRQIQNVLNQKVPGIILSDTAGGGLRTDIQYRGFDASPIGGRSQGLAVYQNGVRINESFGDTVNLDLIPAIAISDITVLGANPIYGLNAIGGAIGITMKDGFSFQGGTIDAMGGSFGRGQIAMEAGGAVDNVAAYAALELLTENGYRDFSDAEISRFYGDIGFRGSAVEVHLSLTAANSVAGVVAASPVEVLDVDWNRTFTSPQETDLEVVMPTLSAKVQATETLSFSGLAYYRKFKSKVIDGNLSEVGPCEGDPTQLCLEGDEPLDPAIPFSDVADAFGFIGDPEDFPFGSIERINQDAKSFGGSVQAVEKARILGRPNQFVVGLSYDHGDVRYNTSSEIGMIGDRFVVDGSGIVIGPPDDPPDPDEPPELAPRVLDTQNDYFGAYFLNTLDVTEAFALTVGGRYNHAKIQIKDETGSLTDYGGYLPDLNVTSTYERFNPMVGGTYKFSNVLNVYGSYAEANRAPTAAELGCAEPDNPCFIESFLTDDPPLEQVVSRTFEAGLRGEVKSYDGQRFSWSAGLFRTLNEDDILNVAAETTGRGYFLNAGDTLRQGIELAAGYQNRMFSVYGSYAFVDATFQDDLQLPAPNTPEGTVDCDGADPGDPDPPQCNNVSDGDRLPGIPRHRFKAGFDYWLTPKWKFGSDFIAATDQVFFGDEANNNRKLSGYTRVDLHTSYQLSENAQIYGLVKNLFDRRYGLYGTFFDADEANEVTEAAGYGDDFFEDPRSITPSQPFAIYGGLKLTF